jgi:hypothetical protein
LQVKIPFVGSADCCRQTIAGLVALSSSPEHAILALLGKNQGHIQIVDLDKGHPVTTVSSTRTNVSSYYYNDRSASTTKVAASISIIPAHTAKLSCLALSMDGSKCASASEKVRPYSDSLEN